MGHGGHQSERSPRWIEGLQLGVAPLRTVAAGGASSAAIDGAGVLWTWGSAAFGAGGHASMADALTPTPVRAFAPAVARAWESRSPPLKKAPLCALTLDVPFDPVTTHCGHTFSRAALDGLRTSATPAAALCPVCRAALANAEAPCFGLELDNRYVHDPALDGLAARSDGGGARDDDGGGARDDGVGARDDDGVGARGDDGGGARDGGALFGSVRVTSVDCGEDHMAACDSEGTLFSWGRDSHGRLGRAPAAGRPRARRAPERSATDAMADEAEEGGDENAGGAGCVSGGLAVGLVDDRAWATLLPGYHPRVVVCGGSHTLALARSRPPAAASEASAAVVHAPTSVLLGCEGEPREARERGATATPGGLDGGIVRVLAGATLRLAVQARDANGNDVSTGGAQFLATLVPAVAPPPAPPRLRRAATMGAPGAPAGGEHTACAFADAPPALRAFGPPPAGHRMTVSDEGGGSYALTCDVTRSGTYHVDVRLVTAGGGPAAHAAPPTTLRDADERGMPIANSGARVVVVADDAYALRSALVPVAPSTSLARAVAGRRETFRILTADRHGNRLRRGGVPFRARLDHLTAEGASTAAAIVDNGDGTYTASYALLVAGRACLRCQLITPPGPLADAQAPPCAEGEGEAAASARGDGDGDGDARLRRDRSSAASPRRGEGNEWVGHTVGDGPIFVHVAPGDPSAAHSTCELLVQSSRARSESMADDESMESMADDDSGREGESSGAGLRRQADGSFACAPGTVVRWRVAVRDEQGNMLPAASALPILSVACAAAAQAEACVRACSDGALIAELRVRASGIFFATVMLGKRERVGPPYKLVVGSNAVSVTLLSH